MLLFKNQHYYLQWYILINMFSLMVFQGLNIFSKQNQEGVCPPHLVWPNPCFLRKYGLGKLKTGTENVLK